MTRTTLLAVVSTWLLMQPELASACAVCFDANDATRQAYMSATILLTGLPLLVIGAGAYWIYRQVNAPVSAEPGGS
ncbi:MAG: hypothetical protein KTR31_19165 [Myxococcales bacterium]|nr:hypothetical protein [Myxococcales bacterium]